MYHYTTHTLANGIRVVLVPQHDTAAVTVLALYKVGSRYESASLSGAAHYIEHMMFKGTAKRPTTMDISRDLDAVGADYNAFTSKDYTGYYVRLQSEKLPLAVDMLHDMLYRSQFREKDLDQERNVIIEEINMYDDNPIMAVEEVMEEELFRGSTLGRKITGTAETMRGIGRKELLAFRDRYYVPERTVLSVAGKFDQNRVLAMLEKTFGKRTANGASRSKDFRPFASPATRRGPKIQVRTRDTEQVQVAIGFPSCGLESTKLDAAMLLATVLGGTMSSRLFMTVREKLGLAYSVGATNHAYQDTGAFVIQAGLAKAKIHQALRVIMRELARGAKTNVSAEELTRAKEYIKGKTVLAFEDSSRLADSFAKQQLLRGKILSPDQRLARMAKVTRDEVRLAAKAFFRKERAALAVIGPFDAKKEDFATHFDAL